MIDPETVIALLRAEGKTVTMTTPGETILDVDGIPAWQAPPTVTDGTVGAVVLTADEWEHTARHLLARLDGMPDA